MKARDILSRDAAPLSQKPRLGENFAWQVLDWKKPAANDCRVREKSEIKVRLASGKLFPGQYYDSETGLHYNYFRDYDPSTGRYIESDPIGLAGGLNTYTYAGGNPLIYADPTGEFVNFAVGAAIGGLSGLVAALNNPCASDGDIAKAFFAGAAVGALTGGFGPGIVGSTIRVMTRQGAAGFTGNSAGQFATMKRGQRYSIGQAATQGAVGAIGGGIGRNWGLSASLSAARSGQSAQAAIEIGGGIGGRIATGVVAGANLGIPGNHGGMAPPDSSSCGCN